MTSRKNSLIPSMSSTSWTGLKRAGKVRFNYRDMFLDIGKELLIRLSKARLATSARTVSKRTWPGPRRVIK